MKSVVLIACIMGSVVVHPVRAAAQREVDTLKVDPARAEIGIFYHGAQLLVSAVVDTGTDIAVLVSGEAENLHLRQQARVWGMFWAPAGEITFDSIPTMYLLYTSIPVEDLAPPRVLTEWRLGYESFWRAGDTGDGHEHLFPDLVRLKESEGLFHYSIGAVRVEPAEGGQQVVTVVVDVTSKARAGVYRVQLFAFRDQVLTARREGTFTLGRSAFNAFVGSLVRQHALLYGILAVVVAGGAGLLVGLLFGSVKGH